MKKALITGITGQDGSYLAEQLLQRGYEVHGIIRRCSVFNTERIDHIFDRLQMHYGDITDAMSLSGIVKSIQPDEIYNLAAMSHVRVSFEIPCYTGLSDAIGVVNLLEAVRMFSSHSKIYQASTSEMFGNSPAPQSELTGFDPQSPYACAKAYAHAMCVHYRQAYNMFICCGLLFNHESPRRGDTFVTKKIAKAAALIKKGRQRSLRLGNIDAVRDWGYAPEYCEAMWMMMQQEKADDFVIATGESHCVRDFLQEVFGQIDLNWHDHVHIDERCLRPIDVNFLCGDYTKAERVLGWKPKVTFKELCRIMIEAEMSKI